MLGERRSNSLFAPAAPAEPERKPEQAEVHDISFEERTERSLFAEASTAPRASELFFAPQEKGVTFAEALSQVQGYLSETYATLITEDNSDAKEQMKRRMARYLQENRIAVDGMTASELVDALYTEMAEYGFLTKYIFADGIEEIDINSWRDIEIQYSDGHIALRFNPDIICVGEMRGPEANAAQEAARVGIAVLTTIHSNSSEGTYRRMVSLCKRAVDTPDDTLMGYVTEAYPIVVYCRQLENKQRRITNISECEILPDGSRRLHKLYEYHITDNHLEGDRFVIEGEHRKCEEISESLRRRFIENGMPLGDLAQFVQGKEEDE